MEYEIYKDGELYHWGIKGMRWGVRRYQNKDGSLTAAGKKKLRAEQAKVRQEEQTLKNKQSVKARLDRLDARKKAVAEGNKELEEGQKKPSRKDKKSSSAAPESGKKSIKDMTDDELTRAISRSKLEAQYRELNPEPPAKKSRGEILRDEIIIPSLTTYGKKLADTAIESIGKRIVNGKSDSNSTEALKAIHDKLELQQKIDKLRNPDKYLSEEDKKKRQERINNAADRAAKMEGYADAADRAAKKREAAEAARKASADEAARKANESMSEEYYNSSYRYVNTGKSSTTAASKNLPATVSNLPAKTVNSGKSRVSGLLEGPKNEPKFILEDKKTGDVIAYWSGIRGDSDVII